MADAAQIRALYEAYIETVETLERNRKPGDGLLGLKKGPADDPCHNRFVDELTEALVAYAAQKPTSAELSQTLAYMYSIPREHREPLSAYWMLMAVQGLSLDLIGGLAPADAAALCTGFRNRYPRRERLPVQNKILSALKKQSREQ